MIPTRPIVITLFLAASAGNARGAEQAATGLQACIDSARQADMICSKLADSPAQWLDCFVHARNEQLACLQRALPDAPARTTATDDNPDAQPRHSAPEPATSIVSSQSAPQDDVQARAPDIAREDRATQPDPLTGPQETAEKQEPDAKKATDSPAAASNVADPSTSTKTAEPPTDTASITPQPGPAPQQSVAPAVETQPPAPPADAVSGPKEAKEARAAAPTETLRDSPKDALKDALRAKDLAKEPSNDSTATAVTAPAKPETPATKQPVQSWLVSEMSSPLDYRPMLTAIIHPTSSSEGGPSSLTIRCLGRQQTSLSIQSGGTWRAARKNAVIVDHQVDDGSAVRQVWTLSVDAKSATYAGDTIALLRSFPGETQLTINVRDAGNTRHDATFQLAGWESVRKQIAKACNWPKPDAQASSGR
jgi:hypothetical protein